MKRIRLKKENCKENQKYRRKGEGYRTNYDDKGLLEPRAMKISDVK